MKYLKWVYGNESSQNNFKYKIDEVMTADNWNKDGGFDNMGGFNFGTEESALRWVSRGNVLYDVIIPNDAEVVNVNNYKTPNGLIRSNKIILTNPKKISDKLMHELYLKSNLPEKTYYESIAALAMHNCVNTALEIIRDKVNLNNIDEVLDCYNNFLKSWHEAYVSKEGWQFILDVLNEIKSPLDISLTVTKEPFIKELTNDNIINLTGQSGSGKSYYAKEKFCGNDYEILDTDEFILDEKYEKTTGINKEFGKYLRKKYDKIPDLGNDFDLIYKEILEFSKNVDKKVVIDCAQFHCIKDIRLLKGKIIVIRTDIDTCYKRTIERWKEIKEKNNIKYSNEEFESYKNKKKNIYKWYKGTNEFIRKVNLIKID